MRKEIGLPSRFNREDFVTSLIVQNSLNNEPDSYEEAISVKDASLWISAMKDEMLSLEKKYGP